MFALKKVVKRIDIEVAEVTLLSRNEYEIAKDNIPLVNDLWWLRSPGRMPGHAAYVSDNGSVYNKDVDCDDMCVRPALRISNPEELNLKLHDKLWTADHWWTIVYLADYCYALCDSVIGKSCFRENSRAENANVYEASDIKWWLDDWVNACKKAGIEIVEKEAW